MSVRDTIKIFVKYCTFGLCGLALVMLGQIGQVIRSNSDLRLHVISTWAGNDPSRKVVAEKFLTTCLGAYLPMIAGRYVPVVLRECGDSVGASELVVELELSDKILKTYAWPLSVFDQYGRH